MTAPLGAVKNTETATKKNETSEADAARPKLPVLHQQPDTAKEFIHSYPELNCRFRDFIDSGSVRAFVARTALPRHTQEIRVVHQVEQVIKPQARIASGPPM
ncbi:MULTISPECIES: hypothetical protein [unclassified Arthrobacter]|uniref:hypothetical protein n=1 Tax=unclassified Pseudarthrobacter TaxID=2647000 RepID=UPI00339B1BB3